MPAYDDRRRSCVDAWKGEVADSTESFVRTVRCRGASETRHDHFLMF